MSLNIINLTGMISKPSYIPAGQPGSNGKVMTFPRFSALVRISDSTIDIGDTTHPLVDQSFWLEIGCPTNNQKVDERRVEALISKIEHGYPYLLLVNGTFSQWTGPSGVRYTIKASFGDVHVSNRQFLNSNRVVIAGQVVEITRNSLIIEERYNVKGEWRSRTVPVYLQRSVDYVQGRTCVVYGRLACRTHTGDRSLYVIAEEVI